MSTARSTIFIVTFFCVLFVSCVRTIDDLYWKANRLVEKKQYAKAINVYDRIIKKRADQKAFFMKAYCYQQDSNYVQAEFFFNRLLSIKGVNLNRTDSSVQVVIDYAPAFSGAHDITLAEIYYQLAITQYSMDSLPKSFQNFQIAINLDYEKGNCMTWQGLIWTRYNKLEKACPLFEQARAAGDADGYRLYNQYCSQKAKP